MTAILQAFLKISLTAAIMICLVGVFRALFSKRISPMIMMSLWFAVLLRLCVPFTIESPIHVGDLIEAPAISQESIPIPVIDPGPVTPAGETAGMDGNGYPDSSLTDTNIADSASTSESTLIEKIGEWLRSVSLWNFLSIVWLTGAAGVLLWTIYQAQLFKREVNAGDEITDDAVLDAINLYKEKLGIKRPIRVMQCDCVDTPAIFGYLRPRLLLPLSFVREVTGERLKHVLLHELCHIRRQDILTGYIWLAVKALHWFNPFVWIAYRLYRDDAELCCDSMVIGHLPDNDPYAYSQTLIDVVRSSKQKHAVTAAASLYENKQKLKERVIRMMNPMKRSKIAVAVSLMLGLVMLIGCFTTACRPRSEGAQKIVYPNEYVAGQDAQYWYTDDNVFFTAMADDGEGYYFMGGAQNAFLYRRDKITGEAAPVCNKYGCEHQYNPYLTIKKGDTCNANLGLYEITSLYAYGDRLYALGRGGNLFDTLYELSKDGDAPREIVQLSGSAGKSAFHRGYVYYTAYTDTAPYQTDPYQPRTENLYRLPIGDWDAAPEVVYSVNGILATIGPLLCYGNFVYFSDGSFDDNTLNLSHPHMSRYNVNTGKVETILDNSTWGDYTIFNGMLAYTTPAGTYLSDLKGKNSRRISDRTGVLSSGDGYLLIDNADQIFDNWEIPRWIFAYDADGNYAGSVNVDMGGYPGPIGVVDGLYIVPDVDDTDTLTMYSIPVDEIADGTAVPGVFYEYVPET